MLALVISIASLCISLIFSYLSTRIAKKALSISEQQEARRQPALRPYLIDGYYKKMEDRKSKVYGFSISVSNPTDAGNSLAHLELEICYVNPKNVCMKLKIPHQDNLANDFGGGSIRPIVVPGPIPAHQTVAGWALFNVSHALLGECVIDSYLINITDAHGAVTIIEPDLVKEFKNV